MKKLVLIVAIVLVVVGGYFGKKWYDSSSTKTPETMTQTTPQMQNSEKSTSKVAFNKSQYSLSDPTSIWVVVNKQRAIPIDFTPNVVVPDVRLLSSPSTQQMHFSTKAAPALKEMFAAAKADGITLVFGSGYRSGALQKQLYNGYKARDGQAKADTYSARPGHSEHQTGLAVDLDGVGSNCYLEICWENTPEGKWVAANSYKYGFIVRYQKNNQAITGYQYEPWHVRYVGKELAKQLHDNNQTMEEFFGLSPAPSYN